MGLGIIMGALGGLGKGASEYGTRMAETDIRNQLMEKQADVDLRRTKAIEAWRTQQEESKRAEREAKITERAEQLNQADINRRFAGADEALAGRTGTPLSEEQRHVIEQSRMEQLAAGQHSTRSRLAAAQELGFTENARDLMGTLAFEQGAQHQKTMEEFERQRIALTVAANKAQIAHQVAVEKRMGEEVERRALSEERAALTAAMGNAATVYKGLEAALKNAPMTGATPEEIKGIKDEMSSLAFDMMGYRKRLQAAGTGNEADASTPKAFDPNKFRTTQSAVPSAAKSAPVVAPKSASSGSSMPVSSISDLVGKSVSMPVTIFNKADEAMDWFDKQFGLGKHSK